MLEFWGAGPTDVQPIHQALYLFLQLFALVMPLLHCFFSGRLLLLNDPSREPGTRLGLTNCVYGIVRGH